MSTQSIPADILANWQQRGLEPERCELDPGERSDRGMHSFDQLVIPIAGILTIEINGDPYTPAVGEELVVPAGTLRIFSNDSLEPVVWLAARMP